MPKAKTSTRPQLAAHPSTAIRTVGKAMPEPMLVPIDGFVRKHQLCAPAGLLPFDTETLRRMVRAGHFPQPVAIPGVRWPVWRVAEVRAWVEQLGKTEAEAV